MQAFTDKDEICERLFQCHNFSLCFVFIHYFLVSTVMLSFFTETSYQKNVNQVFLLAIFPKSDLILDIYSVTSDLMAKETDINSQF